MVGGSSMNNKKANTPYPRYKERHLRVETVKRKLHEIPIGSTIAFYSSKKHERYIPLEHKGYIYAQGTVVDVTDSFVIVELRNNVKECISLFDIVKINGKPNRFFTGRAKEDIYDPIEVGLDLDINEWGIHEPERVSEEAT